MGVTIHDIAKKTGVAASTVSRVINGKSVISEETRLRIIAAMDELGYHPNSVARNLATGNSQAIGMIIDARENNEAYANIFFNRSVFGIESVVQSNGYNLIISNDSHDKGEQSPIERLILERKVDGLILPSSAVTTKLVKELSRLDFPFVILGEPAEFKNETCWVDVNNQQGGYLAVQHLVAQGYKNPAIIGGSQNQVFFINRFKGYRSALEELNLPFEKQWVVETDGSIDSSYEAALQLLGTKGRPDSILCNDNMVAFGALRAARKLGIPLGSELGVITFDNYPLAEYMDPPLSVIDIDTYTLGEQAANVLFQRMRKNTSSLQIQISTNLIERQSTSRIQHEN
jgi:DNA-binding LacI/PurR family transcriptional regulator